MKAEKQIVQVVLERDVVAVIDKIAEEAEVSRSAVLSACVESGLDDLRLLSSLGLTPRRLKLIGQKLVKLGIVKQGEVTVDFRKAKEILE